MNDFGKNGGKAIFATPTNLITAYIALNVYCAFSCVIDLLIFQGIFYGDETGSG